MRVNHEYPCLLGRRQRLLPPREEAIDRLATAFPNAVMVHTLVEDRYNATAQPFQWKFTTSDLDDLLARLDRNTLAERQEESSVALAA